MPKKTTLVVCCFLAIAASAGCQSKVYVGGIGGNIVRISHPDGTSEEVPCDQVEQAKARWKKEHPPPSDTTSQ